MSMPFSKMEQSLSSAGMLIVMFIVFGMVDVCSVDVVGGKFSSGVASVIC
jgi:hypothetical protein